MNPKAACLLLLALLPLGSKAQVTTIYEGPLSFGSTVTDGTTVYGVSGRTLYTFGTDGSNFMSIPIAFNGNGDLHGQGQLGLSNGTIVASGGSGGLTTFNTDGSNVVEIFGINDQTPSPYQPLVTGNRIYGDGWDGFNPPVGAPDFPTAYIYSMNLDGSDVQIVGANGGDTPASTQLATDGKSIFGSQHGRTYAMDISTGMSQVILDRPSNGLVATDDSVFGFSQDVGGSILFKAKKDGTDFEPLHSFASGFGRDLVYDADDDDLIGIHDGDLFQIGADGTGFVVIEADGGFRSDLVVIGRTAYGSFTTYDLNSSGTDPRSSYYSLDLDAAPSNGAVPEPSSAVVWMGLLLAAGLARRYRNEFSFVKLTGTTF